MSKTEEEDLEISHPDKILFPKSGISKQDIADYYRVVAPYMLPQLEGRPISMQRYPEGIQGQSFYQKTAPHYFPDFIKRIPVKLKNGEQKKYVLAENAETLEYLAGISNIPVHVWLSKKGSLHEPDMIIWDFDPSDGDFEKVRKSAFLAREFLGKAGVEPYLKTTGSRGLHVIVPLKVKHKFHRVREAARNIAHRLALAYPELLTIEMLKEEREDLVFVDYLRNGYAQTAVAPYSVRPREKAPVAAPISWEELEDKKLNAQTFTIHNILDRLKEKGDLFKDMNKDAIELERLEEL